MPLQKLQFRPGLVRDVTSYTNEGGWFDTNLTRFRLGLPESIGGWAKYSLNSFLGHCRALLNWVTLDGESLLAVGTSAKYYVEAGTLFHDITPIRKTVTVSNPFTASNGLTTITVTDTSHGATTGDYVIFSGASSLGGNITATVLNAEYKITVLDVNTYTFTATATASASDTGHGGASVTITYLISTGLDTQVSGNGWGAGGWGVSAWGTASTSTAGERLGVWAQDNYGEDLIFNLRNGGVYYWDYSLGYSQRAVALSSLSSDNQTPTKAIQVLVSDRDRHVIAFGANYGSYNPVQDPMIIRFSNQEDPYTWTATATNTAGDLRLGSGSAIIKAIETKREIVVFTDIALYSLQYIGPPYTFGVQQIASSITVNGYNSFVAVDDTVFWMGRDNFYVYSGQSSPLACPVQSYVFGNYNKDQSDKVYAALNSEYSEVTWYYPTADSTENNAYVTYNFADKVWTFGSLARTAWLDKGVHLYPIAAGADGYLYNQEYGFDDGSTDPASPINAYIESSPVDIGEGDRFSFVRRVLPDVKFFDSTNSPSVDVVLKTQNYPGSNYANGSDSSVTRTAVVPIDQYTPVRDVRLRGRSIIFRIESNKTGTRWGLGSPRIEIRQDGGR